LDGPREQSPLERFCALLAEHGVEFIVVGGQAETIPIGGRPVQVIGLDDLIRIKRHINRPKDREPARAGGTAIARREEASSLQ